MGQFDLAKLRRLSEAATKGPYGYAKAHGDIFNDDNDSLIGRSDDEHGPLFAYLGTHRDRIVALLEAADALAEAADLAIDQCGEFSAASHMRPAVAAYKKAKGAKRIVLPECQVAHFKDALAT